MKYFTIKEFTVSDTAKKKGIDNTPSPEIESHIRELVDKILDPLREAWGSGIRVTSGYRCPKLNTAVKGSATSAHMSGYAADLKPVNGKMAEFQSFILDFLKNRPFDQIIIEYPNAKGVASWMHIAIRSSKGLQRRMIFTIK